MPGQTVENAASAPEAPDLSVVVVNWNTCELLQSCLESVFADSLRVSCQVIVVDNGSSDHSIEMVQRCFGDAAVVANADNVGFARACNQGIALAAGRYILLLNSDTRALAGALAALVEYMDEHSDVGIAGARLVDPGGHPQPSHDLFPLTPWRLGVERVVDRLCPANSWTRSKRIARWEQDPREPLEVDWVPGAAMVVRRHVLKTVGLLDEGYPMYAEDIDWCYRAKRAGWRVAYVPLATFVHARGGSSAGRSELSHRLGVQRGRSLVRFYRLHYGPAAAAGMWLILRLKRLRRPSASGRHAAPPG